MNDNNLDLTKILEGCEGVTLYFTLYGDCRLSKINKDIDDALTLQDPKTGRPVGVLKKNGKKFDAGDCLLFPSKDQRDWSKFVKPFDDGTYIVANGRLAIFKEYDDDEYIDVYAAVASADDPKPNELFIREPGEIKQLIKCDNVRACSKNEIENLNEILKNKGYVWDSDKKEVKTLKWKPKPNQLYFFIMSQGAYEPIVVSNAWKGSAVDNDRYKHCNCFSNKEEAEMWSNRFREATKHISEDLKKGKR